MNDLHFDRYVKFVKFMSALRKMRFVKYEAFMNSMLLAKKELHDYYNPPN